MKLFFKNLKPSFRNSLSAIVQNCITWFLFWMKYVFLWSILFYVFETESPLHYCSILLVQTLPSRQYWGSVVPRIFTARKRSLGQGNIFTSVCHSVHRGGGVCATHAPSPQACTPKAHMPPPGTHVPPAHTPRRHVCPRADSTRCGQWAGGTHPTGMHSCLWIGTVHVDDWPAEFPISCSNAW